MFKQHILKFTKSYCLMLIVMGIALLNNSNILNAQTKPTQLQAPSISTPADFEYQRDDETGGLIITKYKGKATTVNFPATYNGKTITWILGNVFSNYTSNYATIKIRSVTIPNTIEVIIDETFKDLQSLVSVTIPNSVTVIGENVFSNCTGLMSITIPNSVTTIKGSAFYGCKSLTNITIPNSLTNIENNVFSYCTGLTNVTIPNSITNIGDEAFANCKNLINITIPNSVTSIGKEAFSGCSRLTNITMPNSVNSIGNKAFSGCSNLSIINVGNDLYEIGSDAFDECDNLTRVNITSIEPPNDIRFSSRAINLTIHVPANSVNDYKTAWSDYKTIIVGDLPINPNEVNNKLMFNEDSNGNWCLIGYTGSLKKLVIPATYQNKPVVNIAIDREYGISKSVEEIIIPSSVTSIGTMAFDNCTWLKSITIPNSVTSIGGYAFFSCTGLTSITIPNSVTTIGANAFNKCSSLTSIIMEAITPPTTFGASVFINSSHPTLKIYVPSGRDINYKNAGGWSTYASIIF